MNVSNKIRVVLVDDHKLIRAGLSQLINAEEDLTVQSQASNGKELLDLLAKADFDVVLLDIDMPVMDGKATLDRLVVEYPKLKVIMLTVHQHDSFIVHMMKAGAHGYLLKDSEPEEVIRAIRKVHDEGLFFNDRVSRALLGDVSGTTKNHEGLASSSLSQRERDVLKLICEEKTTSQIADVLFLSPKTIENYRKSLLDKTDTKNAAGLAIYAVRNGLV